MANFIRPYNDDPFVGHLSSPITTSASTRALLGNMPAYRRNLSPVVRRFEIGLAHGYFLVGPFDKLGPLRNSEMGLLAGFLSALGLVTILAVGLTIYGIASFQKADKGDGLQTSEGWSKFTGGFTVGAYGGALFAFLLLKFIF